MTRSDELAVSVNGAQHHCPPGTSIALLLDMLALKGKKIAVERNGEVIPRSQHASTPLSQGDVLEIVVAVGGG